MIEATTYGSDVLGDVCEAKATTTTMARGAHTSEPVKEGSSCMRVLRLSGVNFSHAHTSTATDTETVGLLDLLNITGRLVGLWISQYNGALGCSGGQGAGGGRRGLFN